MIDDYIEYISLKRDELGGHAICPYAKAFLNKTEIIESNNFLKDAVKCMNNKSHPMLYIIYGNRYKYNTNWLDHFCKEYKDYSRSKDLWLIWDHPDQINSINGVQTNNKEYAILMIQGLSELNKYSLKLKKTNYYKFWEKKYYNQIVESRL
jgi:hypothetical protein